MKYLYVLPHLNAILNALSGLLLVTGYLFIRRRRITAHRNCLIAALATSTLFLASYLTYHYYHGSTRFTGQGAVRALYFAILISHTILAAVIVPFIGVTLYRASRWQFAKHMRIARWTFPMWLYVSVTGVVVYLMLYQLYPAR
jgi:putative membrane protein